MVGRDEAHGLSMIQHRPTSLSYLIFWPAASSFDLVGLPEMLTVKLKDCCGLAPSVCLTRLGLVTRLIKGHLLCSRLLRDMSHIKLEP